MTSVSLPQLNSFCFYRFGRSIRKQRYPFDWERNSRSVVVQAQYIFGKPNTFETRSVHLLNEIGITVAIREITIF
jgi:hypothetical protein